MNEINVTLVLLLGLINLLTKSQLVRTASTDKIFMSSDDGKISQAAKQTCGRDYDADGYWRPWTSSIPEDAVVGGYIQGNCKEPIYLGQVQMISHCESGVFPMAVFSNHRYAKFTKSGQQLNAMGPLIRVLCAADPNIFTWISNREAQQINVTVWEDCLIAGYEYKVKQDSLFGRAIYNNETIIGKAFYQRNKMYFPYNGEEKAVDEFEILCYARYIKTRREEAIKLKAGDTQVDAEAKGKEGERRFYSCRRLLKNAEADDLTANTTAGRKQISGRDRDFTENGNFQARKTRQLSEEDLFDRDFGSGVHWRPWNWGVPKDAVLAGYKQGDCRKEPIYLGHAQVIDGCDSAVFPVAIFSNHRHVEYTQYGGNHIAIEDIWVLCADDPDILMWISNKEAQKIHVETMKDCVSAGHEYNIEYDILFGRATYDDETVIGKVFYKENRMLFPYYGGEKIVTEYEILCYAKHIETRRQEAIETAEPEVNIENSTIHMKASQEGGSIETTNSRLRNHEADIYWKPWRNHIPKDAVIGGFREGYCGKYAIHLGQVLTFYLGFATIPVEVNSQTTSVLYTSAGEQIETSKDDVMILCSRDPSGLTWISDEEARNINITAEEDCVIGGVQYNFYGLKVHTYFGRLEKGGEIIIGKVRYDTDFVIFPRDGYEQFTDEYEILCYKESIEAQREAAADVRRK